MVKLQPVLIAGVAVLAAGCASDAERATDARFGDSVRRTISMQTASPGAAGTGLDAIQAAAVLKAYREDVADRKQVEQQLSTKSP